MPWSCEETVLIHIFCVLCKISERLILLCRETFLLQQLLSLMYVYQSHVPFKTAFLLENSRANLALEGFDVTQAMYSSKVFFKAAFLCELPAANLALVPGVRMLWSLAAAAALSMSRVVVSVDRC